MRSEVGPTADQALLQGEDSLEDRRGSGDDDLHAQAARARLAHDGLGYGQGEIRPDAARREGEAEGKEEAEETLLI